jgi:hypothetical protein
MASTCRALGVRIALGVTFMLSACQHDSTAEFDDASSPSAGTGGSGDTGPEGAGALAGEDAGGGNSVAGTASDMGGSGAVAGNASGGKAGAASGGKATGGAAGAANGGKAGMSAGGSTAQAGKGGGAGTGGGGGSAGSATSEPITVDTTDIDDAHIASCFPNLNFGEALTIDVDGDATCRYETLIDAPRTTLPDGALVSRAILTLTCSNAGEAVTVSYVDQAWAELMVRWTNRPDVGAALGMITCAKQGEVEIDLTAAFQAWVSGDQPAHGIYLRSEHTDGTDFASSEAVAVSERPRLSITYTLP